ncbi:MAG TPA: hypothetical protein VF630_18200 [Hymenobacter sp.]
MSFAANPYKQLQVQGRTSYRPEDINEYGVERFLQEQEARGSLPAPGFVFTAEENRLMDIILAEERGAADAA